MGFRFGKNSRGENSVKRQRWSISAHKFENGCKQVGLAIWWNSNRVGFQINVGIFEIQVMREN
ncbi:hypothetical protein SEA_DOXI13_30 [Streptomyces phage Doxi13]|nr:hypothetical protein SEA_DOXI13_30 [Streptomyces phage Doxi13]